MPVLHVNNVASWAGTALVPLSVDLAEGETYTFRNTGREIVVLDAPVTREIALVIKRINGLEDLVVMGPRPEMLGMFDPAVYGRTVSIRVMSAPGHVYATVYSLRGSSQHFTPDPITVIVQDGGPMTSSILTATLPAIPDRQPATDPDGATYSRTIGLTGRSPLIQADIDDAQRIITDADDFQGGNHGTTTGSRANTLPNQQFGNDLDDYLGLTFSSTVQLYVWFGINVGESTGLTISSVTYNGVDIPVTKQADQVTVSANTYDIWISDQTYTWAELKDHPFILTVERDPAAPATFNRYAAVTQLAVPTAADFLSPGASTSPSIRIRIPAVGWANSRGYLHFALPSDQDTPTVAGLPAGTNLIDSFTVRDDAADIIDINGDTMRTMSSVHPVYQLIDRFGLFLWIIR